jgi:hypothetical protein
MKKLVQNNTIHELHELIDSWEINCSSFIFDENWLRGDNCWTYEWGIEVGMLLVCLGVAAKYLKQQKCKHDEIIVFCAPPICAQCGYQLTMEEYKGK